MAAPLRNGRLVALCGIDGSGKTTQSRLLARRAEEQGLAVQTVSFPRYGQGFFADLVERYLRGDFARRAGGVSPYLAALPYALDRWQAGPELRRWLAAGCLVVCNRYVAANMAHQGSKLRGREERIEFYRWTAELEYGVLGLPRPHLQVLLDAPPSVTSALVSGRDAARGQTVRGDIHEGDVAYLEATAAAYREVAAQTPGPWTVVDCVEGGRLLPPERIAEQVWSAVCEVVYDMGSKG